MGWIGWIGWTSILGLLQALAVHGLTAWDTATNEACRTIITQNSMHAGAETGAIFCYNIPFLNVLGGDFAVDVRKFLPSSQNALAGAKLGLQLDYHGASIKSAITQEGSQEQNGLKKRHLSTLQPQISVWQFTGSLGPAYRGGDLQANLTPNITVLASMPNGQVQRIPLARSEVLAFVNGLFVNETELTERGFPGRTLAVEPIGTYVYSAWLGVLLLTIFCGAWQRQQSRYQFRRRVRGQILQTSAL